MCCLNGERNLHVFLTKSKTVCVKWVSQEPPGGYVKNLQLLVRLRMWEVIFCAHWLVYSMNVWSSWRVCLLWFKINGTIQWCLA